MALSSGLSASEREQTQQWVSAHGTPQQVALHCRIVLATADGHSDVAIARQLSVNRKTVILWRQRFFQQRLDGLWEIAPGRGRKPNYDIDKIAAIVDATLQTKPEGMTHWSCRTMAKSQGVSKSTINNIWQAHQLKPHRVKTFKLSRDPKFLEKMTDVIGLYLNPPQLSGTSHADDQYPACRIAPPGLSCVRQDPAWREPNRAQFSMLVSDVTRPHHCL
jgi:transposase